MNQVFIVVRLRPRHLVNFLYVKVYLCKLIVETRRYAFPWCKLVHRALSMCIQFMYVLRGSS